MKLEKFWLGPRSRTPALVFLHEGLGSAGMWRDFPEKLSQAVNLPAFVYSRAGYGKSEPAPLPRAVTYMHDEAKLLAQLLRDEQIERPILIGHSDGASIAILYEGPASALILEAPHVFTEPSGLASIERARVEFLTGGLRPKLARWHDDPDAAFWGWNGPWLDPAFRAWNIEHRLPLLKAPILVIQGADDEYGTRRQLDAIPGEKLLLDKCGHAPHRDQPDKTLTAMRDFIAKLAID